MLKRAVLAFAILCGLILGACGAPLETATHTESETTTEATVDVTEEITEALAQTTSDTQEKLCEYHPEYYHAFPKELLSYTDSETYEKWYAQQSKKTPEYDHRTRLCPIEMANIYEFVHAFDVPKEELIELYNAEILDRDVNIDLIYGDTDQKNEIYYRQINSTAQTPSQSPERDSFERLKAAIPLPDDIVNGFDYRAKSLAELVYLSGMSVAELEQLRQDMDEKFEYKYDFSLINGLTREELKKLIDTEPWHYIDNILCGQRKRYKTLYERQCAENIKTYVWLRLTPKGYEDVLEEYRYKISVSPCTVHALEYHSFSYTIVDEYIGDQELFEEWGLENTMAEDRAYEDCPQGGLYKFVRDFNVPKELYIQEYNRHAIDADINIDLLYHGTLEQNDTYYRELLNKEDVPDPKRENYDSLRKKIWIEKLGTSILSVQEHLVDLMYRAELTVDDVNTYREQLKQEWLEKHEGEIYEEYDYDFSFLEGLDRDGLKELLDTQTWYYLDRLVCNLIPYKTRYDRQCAENEAYFAEHGIVLDIPDVK